MAVSDNTAGTPEIVTNFSVNFANSISSADSFKSKLGEINGSVETLIETLSKFGASAGTILGGAESLKQSASKVSSAFKKLNSALDDSVAKLDSVAGEVDSVNFDAATKIVESLKQFSTKINELSSKLNLSDVEAEMGKVDTTIADKVKTTLREMAKQVKQLSGNTPLDTGTFTESFDKMMSTVAKDVNTALNNYMRQVNSSMTDAISLSAGSLNVMKDFSSLSEKIQQKVNEQLGVLDSEVKITGVNSKVLSSINMQTNFERIRTAYSTTVNKSLTADTKEFVAQIKDLKPSGSATLSSTTLSSFESLISKFNDTLQKSLALDMEEIDSQLSSELNFTGMLNVREFASLPKAIQQVIARQLGVAAEDIQSLGVGSTQLTGASLQNSIEKLRSTFQQGIRNAMNSDVNSLKTTIKSIDMTTDSSLPDLIISKMNELNRAVVAKIRESVNAQVNFIRDSIVAVVPKNYSVSMANLQNLMSQVSMLKTAGNSRTGSSTLAQAVAAQSGVPTSLENALPLAYMSNAELAKAYTGTPSSNYQLYSDIKAMNTAVISEAPTPQFVRGDRQLGVLNPQEELLMGHKTLEGSAIGMGRNLLAFSLMGLPFTAGYAAYNDYNQYQAALTKVQQNLGLNQNRNQALVNAKQVLDYTQQQAVAMATNPQQAYQAVMLATRRYKNVNLANQFTSQIMQLNTADNVDYTTGSKAYEAFLAAYGQTPQTANYYARMVTAAAHSSQATGTDISQALEQSASIARPMQLTPAQLTAMIAATITNTGQTGYRIGQFMKALPSRLTNSSALKALNAVGINALNTTTGAQMSAVQLFQAIADKLPTLNKASQTVLLQKVFGTYHIAQAEGLLQAFQPQTKAQAAADAKAGIIRTFPSLLSHIQNFSQADQNKVLAEKTNSYTGAIQQARSTFAYMSNTLLNELEPSIVSIAHSISGVFKFIADNSNSVVAILGQIPSLLASFTVMNLYKRAKNSFLAGGKTYRMKVSGDQIRQAAQQQKYLRALYEEIARLEQLNQIQEKTTQERQTDSQVTTAQSGAINTATEAINSQVSALDQLNSALSRATEDEGSNEGAIASDTEAINANADALTRDTEALDTNAEAASRDASEVNSLSEANTNLSETATKAAEGETQVASDMEEAGSAASGAAEKVNSLASAYTIISDNTRTLEDKISSLKEVLASAGGDFKALAMEAESSFNTMVDESAMTKTRVGDSMMAMGESMKGIFKSAGDMLLLNTVMQQGGKALSALTQTKQQDQAAQQSGMLQYATDYIQGLHQGVGKQLVTTFAYEWGAMLGGDQGLTNSVNDTQMTQVENQVNAVAKKLGFNFSGGVNPTITTAQENEIMKAYISTYGNKIANNVTKNGGQLPSNFLQAQQALNGDVKSASNALNTPPTGAAMNSASSIGFNPSGSSAGGMNTPPNVPSGSGSLSSIVKAPSITQALKPFVNAVKVQEINYKQILANDVAHGISAKSPRYSADQAAAAAKVMSVAQAEMNNMSNQYPASSLAQNQLNEFDTAINTIRTALATYTKYYGTASNTSNLTSTQFSNMMKDTITQPVTQAFQQYNSQLADVLDKGLTTYSNDYINTQIQQANNILQVAQHQLDILNAKYPASAMKNLSPSEVAKVNSTKTALQNDIIKAKKDVGTAKVKGENSYDGMSIRSYETYANRELYGIMYGVQAANYQSQAKLDQLRLTTGAMPDSYAYMQLQAQTNTTVSVAAANELAQLKKIFPNPNSIPTEYVRNNVLQRMAQLQQEQLNAQVATLDLWQKQLGSFNLPSGLTAMSYYNYVSQGQTGQQYTMASNGVTVQIHVNNLHANNMSEVSTLGNEIGKVVSKAHQASAVGAGSGLRSQVNRGAVHN